MITQETKIRHNVIPELKKINPSFEASLKRLCDDAKLLSVYLDKQTDKAVADSRLAFGYSAKKICEQDKIIRQNVIKKNLC